MDDLARQVAAYNFQSNETNVKNCVLVSVVPDVILDPILINDKELECVDNVQILGPRIFSER